jgi:hypothetical protein
VERLVFGQLNNCLLPILRGTTRIVDDDQAAIFAWLSRISDPIGRDGYPHFSKHAPMTFSRRAPTAPRVLNYYELKRFYQSP